MYYRLNFSLRQHHQWSLGEIDNMYPFERDLYLDMLNALIEEQNQKGKSPDIL